MSKSDITGYQLLDCNPIDIDALTIQINVYPWQRVTDFMTEDNFAEGFKLSKQDGLQVSSLIPHRHHEQRDTCNLVDLAMEAGHSALYAGAQIPLTSLAQIVDRVVDTRLSEKLDIIPAPDEAELG